MAIAMLNLNQAATIDPALSAALALVPEAIRKDEWERQTNNIKAFKKLVKDHGMVVQSEKCAWCESKIGPAGRRSVHRDHIAPKDLYSQWTFEPWNIVLSCEFCNGFEIKKDLDTVEVRAATYENSTFNIVHPYFDDTSIHIGFVEDGNRLVVQGFTNKGLWTIERLKLDSASATASRALEKVLADANLPNHLAELVEQAMNLMR